MAESDAVENTWVFDSLVGFLQGPIWNAPVITFIEQKSPSSYFLYLLIYIINQKYYLYFNSPVSLKEK